MYGLSRLEHAVLDHDDSAFVATDQARNVLRVRHRRTQYQRMPLRVFRNQVECVGHFAIVKRVDAAGRHHARRKLRLIPADVQRSDDVEEQIGRDAA